NGPGALTLSSIAITGTNASDFARTTTCPLSPAMLAVSASCTISVTFTPTATGTRTAAVTVTDNGSGSPQAVGLSGTGAAPAVTPWPNGYSYEATFTVAAGQVPSAQANFPALIAGTYPDLKTLANGGRINNTCPQAENSDRKSTRLNSSHGSISYAVFCLKKKKKELRKESRIVILELI